MSRAERLTLIERRSWNDLRAAHRTLADQHPDGAQAKTCRRLMAVADARWRRAINDLDRSLSRPTQEVA